MFLWVKQVKTAKPYKYRDINIFIPIFFYLHKFLQFKKISTTTISIL